MQIAFFSAKPYDRRFFDEANQDHGHTLRYLDTRLTTETAALAQGSTAVCAFVNDQLDAAALTSLHAGGTRLIALRSAGYNHIDLATAARLRLTVVRVPRYSPHAVAEHTLALALALNRHVHRAYHRVREGNFALEGLLGFDFHGKTVGLIGLGTIGLCTAHLFRGLGCEVLGADPLPPADLAAQGITLVPLETLTARADVISLHCPLTPRTRHLINTDLIGRMKPGVMLLNTSRGGLVDTAAVIQGLLAKRIGYVGLDVYEAEADLFYEDRSNHLPTDEVFARLLTFPNVLVTGHQAFFTQEALREIARVTLQSITAFAFQQPLAHEVRG